MIDDFILMKEMFLTILKSTIISKIYFILSFILIHSVFYFEGYPDNNILLLITVVLFVLLFIYHSYKSYGYFNQINDENLKKKILRKDIIIPIFLVIPFTLPVALINFFDFIYEYGEFINTFKLLFPTLLAVYFVEIYLKHKVYIKEENE